jgi:hypothetical protein
MVLWSLSNEILWPYSVESSSYFRLIEQVSEDSSGNQPDKLSGFIRLH